MLIIYFLLGLGITTAHSDYGVSLRAQNFDKTVQNIDKEAYIKHQREKRFVTEYFVPQNVPNRPSWGSNSSRGFVAYDERFQYGNRPSRYNALIPNTDTEEVIPNTDTNNQRVRRLATGYFVPQNLTNKPTWGNLNIARNHTTPTGPYGNMTDVTGKYVNPGQNYNTNVTWSVDPTYNYIKVSPGYNINGNNTSTASGYNVPVNSVTPWNTLNPGYPGYPAPNTGYPARNTGFPAQNTGYPASNPVPNTGYPVPNTGYPEPNTGYPARNTGFPAQNTGYPASNPVPNTGYPVPNTGYPMPNTGYPVPNTGYPTQNTGYPASNTNPGQNYNTTVTRPVYPNYNNTIARPVNKSNFNNSNRSGYNVQPVNPVTPGNTPYYPVPNTGYPASNTGNLAPNTGYPVPNTGYPASNTGYRVPSTGYHASSGYPAPNNGYPASSGYPVTNTFYPPPSSVIPPANVTGFVPKPNPAFTIHDAVPRNNTNGFNNNANGFNNTASLTNCKCNLPRANSTIIKEERTMDACIIVCNACPVGMKRSAFGACVKDLDYDDEY